MAQAAGLHPGFVRDHARVLAISVAAHVAVLVLLVVNLEFWSRPAPPPAGALPIQAVVVDARALRAEQARRQARVEEAERARQADREAREEEQRREARQLAEARERTEQAKRQQAEQQQRARAEKQRTAAEAAQRQSADAAKHRADEATKQKAAADEAAKQKAVADEARRKAENDRRQAAARAELARQIAEEERVTDAVNAGAVDRYAEQIRQKVERNWIRPAGVTRGLNCTVFVKQIPGGDVVDVRIGECNGDAAVLKSISDAVLRSSPLPPPPDPALFEKSLRFDFKPQE